MKSAAHRGARLSGAARRVLARWCARSLLVVASAVGCSAPTLTRDGQLAFTPGGARGASVITANGVEFLDRTDIPDPVVRRSVNQPWRPATGFLLPADGIWRETSTPKAIQGPGLAVALRSSDRLVPSWGGEVLLRMDAIVPAEAFPGASVRDPARLAIVIDGHTPNTAPLIAVAIENLGGRDRVTLIDSGRARTVVPMLPGTHRTLLSGAVDRVVAPSRAKPPRRDLAAALALARAALGATGSRSVLVVSDGIGVAEGRGRVEREARALEAAGARIVAVGAPDRLDPSALAALQGEAHAGGSFQDREDAVAAVIPPPGDVVLHDVVLTISSVPAPARVVELSGGTTELSLDVDRLFLGDLYAGEARTEVARVALPVWVAGEPLELTVTTEYRDDAGNEHRAHTSIKCRYSNDVEAIAGSRHGDVIAYASALAMVRRLNRAFAGSRIDRLGGLRPVVAMQASSLHVLARTQHDPALSAQAEVLTTLLGALDD